VSHSYAHDAAWVSTLPYSSAAFSVSKSGTLTFGIGLEDFIKAHGHKRPEENVFVEASEAERIEIKESASRD
jgi:hypothetical protein